MKTYIIDSTQTNPYLLGTF